jgi:hypothetical protein
MRHRGQFEEEREGGAVCFWIIGALMLLWSAVITWTVFFS